MTDLDLDLDGLAKELRAAYFRTHAGTIRCHDAAAWERVAERAVELIEQAVLA